MEESTRVMPWDRNTPAVESLITREWIMTNGLGGYASGTISGVLSRRYHSLLTAALPGLGRMVMLSHVAEHLILPDGRVIKFGAEERTETELAVPSASYLSEFRLDTGIPVWKFEIEDYIIEKYIVLPYMQNTVHINYKLLSAPSGVDLQLQPSLHFRVHDERISQPISGQYIITGIGDRYEITGGPDLPKLRMVLQGERKSLTLQSGILREVFCRVEAERGYDACGILWTPGYFTSFLAPGRSCTYIASTEEWPTVFALKPDEIYRAEIQRKRKLISMAMPEARSGTEKELVFAADQFIITPAGRAEDEARANAYGDEIRTMIAGYHWFTDWGRDTMISLEGLTLITGRYNEAAWILSTFRHYVRNGLIPNMFPEGEKEGRYNTSDATLWFFHAIDRYLAYTNDRATLRLFIPVLQSIVDYHLRGTRYGIGVDYSDGLLRQGQQDYQLTWMDAKVGNWVVTPRRGKAVEINALWYNALKLLETWLREETGEHEADAVAGHAERARDSFNQRFWFEGGGYLYDVIDGEHGDDMACRPNQILSISLSYPILDTSKWEKVIQIVKDRLLTPYGLRTLSRDHHDYKPKYFGDLHSRDAAYHQGTVWPWLIGPFIDAWLRIYPDDKNGARSFLEGFYDHLGEAGMGSISEIFDAEEPFVPRGCIAQAWSVAEVLRCLIKTRP